MIKYLLIFLAGLLIPLTGFAEDIRPNILFAFADDWGKYASAYAKTEDQPSPNTVVSTPTFDRIADQGVLFKHAFVTAPSCTPCRSSLLSGQYFFRTGMGAILQGARWDPSIPVYPLMLRDAGYHIGETYKVWSPGTPTDAPYGAGKHGYEKSGSRFNGFSQMTTKRVADGISVKDAKQVLYDEVMGNFNRFLDDRDDGKPFCYWFGPTLVHRKWTKGSGKDLWGINPDDLKGKLPKFLPDVHEVRQDFADYLGEVQAFDTALGLILKRLEVLGELDHTVVVISGDHGAPGFPGGKCNLYDFGVQVPLAIWWPGQPGGRVVDDFVNLMDLAPTFLEIGGVKRPKVMTGKSLVPVLKSKKQGLVDKKRNWVITGRERHVARAREGCYLIRNVRFAPGTICTSSTSRRIAGRWATRTTSPPTARRISRYSRTTPSLPMATSTPARPRRGSSSGATTRNGSGTTTTLSPNARAKSCTCSTMTPTKSTTWPATKNLPPSRRN